jgi:hypothetical protein
MFTLATAIRRDRKEESMKRTLALVSASLVLVACADPTGPSVVAPRLSIQATPQELFSRFVSLGTSNSMGVVSAGVNAAGQRSAWPAQLASRVGVPFSMPLIQDPGCSPPLLAPLAANLVLIAGFAAFGEDLVSAVMDVCMPLRDGITLPTNNVAISGAKAYDALYTTPEGEAAHNARAGELYRRVLPTGQTQVTAMLAQNPTFVSVELAANEVLPASTGRIAAMTPFESWMPIYDQIIDAVKSTGAPAVLVGLPNNAANFPSIRRAREFFNEWPDLLALGISMSLNCYFSSNYVFVPGYVLTLISKSPTTATCRDVPGEVDYILTSSDISTINARMARMNAHIEARANENGYAFFKLAALYDLPKINFNLVDVLFSNSPFGPNISLDGVHPSAQGQSILANAAVQAINAKYGLAIP